jgi:hypothetical protein
MMMGLWPLSFAVLLIGCADQPLPQPLPPLVKREEVKIHLPDDLLVCAEAPEPPLAGATQRDVANWIVDDHTAGEDCRQHLKAARALNAAP